ncbi:MAG: TylF/MycF family methyltransferase [Spirochaetales bacterium]|nr:TylF/MycF family methyltransferase [Spirochaetales bacterium]
MADQSSRNTTPGRGRTYPDGYGIVEPVANYRPWDVDADFQAIYGDIREHTMVDIYRLWILWVLARRAPEGAVLEVGSWRGGSGAVLARAAGDCRAVRVPPGAAETEPPAGELKPTRVYLADTFAGVVKAGKHDSYYRGGEHANTSPEHVRSLLDRLDLPSVELLVGIFPDDTASRIETERFALCHIDVDVYQSAWDTFWWVWPRLAPGGIAVFDDYGFYGCEGVTACVEEIMAELPGVPVIPNLSGQAVVVKAGG